MTTREATGRPDIAGAITFFYFDDLATAVCWYRDVLGLEPYFVRDWLALLTISPGHSLGLVDAENGSQRPVPGPNKGAILSIETRDLDEWHARLKSAGVAVIDEELRPGCEGRTMEFRVRDPGGYFVEFFRWVYPPTE